MRTAFMLMILSCYAFSSFLQMGIDFVLCLNEDLNRSHLEVSSCDSLNDTHSIEIQNGCDSQENCKDLSIYCLGENDYPNYSQRPFISFESPMAIRNNINIQTNKIQSLSPVLKKPDNVEFYSSSFLSHFKTIRLLI